MKKKSIVLACAAVGVACALTSCKGSAEIKEPQEDLNERVVLCSENDVTNAKISEAFDKIVRPGDIWFDAIGVHNTTVIEFWTGHCGIVKKVEYDATLGQYKLLVIESNPEDGVQEHYVTVSRFKSQESQILRVKTRNESVRATAIKFCEDQIGKPYPSYSGIPNFLWKKDPSTSDGKKDIEAENCSWYCSELVWAAYKKSGIDIEGGLWGIPEHHVSVSPYEIEHSEETLAIVKYNDLSYMENAQRVSQEFRKIVKPGDIWFDAIGLHNTTVIEFWTGHCGIVEKVEYDYSLGQYKLKMVESNPGDGVQVHYVTPFDFIAQESQILRVRTNDQTRKEALAFCQSQVGKPYPSYSGIPNFNWKKDPSTSEGKKDIANSNCSWYCSELVWAAYKKNHIDIEGGLWGIPEHHVSVSPYEIEHSDKTYAIVKYNSKVNVWSHGSSEHGYYFEDGTVNYESHELETSGRYSHCKVCGGEFWQPC